MHFENFENFRRNALFLAEIGWSEPLSALLRKVVHIHQMLGLIFNVLVTSSYTE